MYTTATILEANVNGDGSSTLVIGFTGDANEDVVRDKLPIAFATTPDPDYVRRYAINKLAGLNATKTFYAGKVAKGVIDTSTALPTAIVDSELAAFLQLFQIQKATRLALTFGFATADDVTTADKAAQAAYQPRFLTILRAL